MLVTSQLVMLLFSGTSSFTQPTFSSALFIDGCPKHLEPSAGVTLLLNFKHHPKRVFLPLSALQKLPSTFLIFCSILPYFKANFGAEMQLF
jgi:hypothetical protein